MLYSEVNWKHFVFLQDVVSEDEVDAGFRGLFTKLAGDVSTGPQGAMYVA